MNKIKKCLLLLAVSSKCLRIHYNKEYSCTIRMLLGPTSSCREVVRRFQANYPGMRVPSREVVRLPANKFRETGSILDKKRNVKRRVLTVQKLEEIGERLEKNC